MKECMTFIDDIIVPGCSFEQELERLEHVFQKVREHNLKLNPKKCEFFKRKVRYCGHIVSEKGVETDPDKTAKIAEWPVPQDVKQLRQFLGFAGYYRRFVKNFSKIARPLTDLLTGVGGRKSQGNSGTKVSVPWVWGEEQVSAFTRLKGCLTSPPVLAYADYGKSFILHTDASRDGLGAVLCQKDGDGRERVISYGSRALSRAERNYSAYKLEFLALKWSVTVKFHDYLYGNNFLVLTDNNPLTYVLSTAKLDATGHRWLAALAAYDFSIQYRPGRANVDADLLSRLPGVQVTVEPESEVRIGDSACVISSESVAAVCKALVSHPTPVVETVILSDHAVQEQEFDVVEDMRPTDLRAAQRRDSVIRALLPFVTDQKKPTPHQLPGGLESQQFIREFAHLTLKRGVLHRVRRVDGREQLQLVLPKELRKVALTGLHDDVGHHGRDKTLELVRERFFWPRMATDIEEWVSSCMRCKVSKGSGARAPLVNIVTTQPMELVCLDY